MTQTTTITFEIPVGQMVDAIDAVTFCSAIEPAEIKAAVEAVALALSDAPADVPAYIASAMYADADDRIRWMRLSFHAGFNPLPQMRKWYPEAQLAYDRDSACVRITT